MFDTEASPMHMTPLNDFSQTADERLTKFMTIIQSIDLIDISAS